MDDNISLTCPRCKTTWKKSLQSLERMEEVYRNLKGTAQPEKSTGKVANYRDQCPVCGTFVVVTVEED